MIPNNIPTDDEVSRALDVLARAEREQIEDYVSNECDGIDDRLCKLATLLEKTGVFAEAVSQDAWHLAGEHDYICKYKCYGDKELENTHQDIAEHHVKLGELADAPVKAIQDAIKNIKANI
jgi:hypothetical protein